MQERLAASGRGAGVIAQRAIDWQLRAGRHDLPWQRSRDPYRIWLSEIMLQQTQVATVVPYFERFVTAFPDLRALADAPLEKVLEAWSGLGYYSRARNLHACARALVERYEARFPTAAAELATLPGIGRSTAAAIASLAFGERAAILDGNVKRVLARVFEVAGPAGAAATERELWRLAERELPLQRVDVYTQAMMDLGATVCTRTRPRCDACPLAAPCAARANGRQHLFPQPRAPRRGPERQAVLALVQRADKVLLVRRPAPGIWGGLWSLPELTAREPQAIRDELGLRFGVELAELDERAGFRHVFTHFRLAARVWHGRCGGATSASDARAARAGEPDTLWLPLSNAPGAALPAPIKSLLVSIE